MLLDLALSSGVKSLSIAGMAKNAGKTVVLNHLVKQAAERGTRLGLTSIGRDGEQSDAVFGIPKPRIMIYSGTVVATTRDSLNNSTAKLQVLSSTGFQTAMGEVVICQAETAGFVEIVGPATARQQRLTVGLLARHGADLVIIDGALDRVSLAAPLLADAVILATGAALGPAIADVLNKTADRIEYFQLPQVEGTAELELYRRLLETKAAALLTRQGGVTVLESAGSLTAGAAILKAYTADVRAVVLAGAAGNSAVGAMLECVRKYGPAELVINNGAHFFADKLLYSDLVRAGGRVSVVHPIKLLAVTVNPVSPYGPVFSPAAFLQAARETFFPVPVTDVVLTESWRPGEYFDGGKKYAHP